MATETESSRYVTHDDIIFKGFKRPNGRIGIRNHLAIIPASVCATPLVRKIAACSAVPVVSVLHQAGCCQIGEDYDRTKRVLIGLALNPNVAGVLIVALGCEGCPFREIVKAVTAQDTPVELVVIQDAGGTEKALQLCLDNIDRISRTIQKRTVRVNASASDLVIGLECGGSDTTSGLIANPVMGCLTDRVVAAGGTAILSETTELIGAEHLLADKIRNEAVKRRLLATVARVEEKARASGIDIRGTQPTPGNITGGLSTIEEKSLGCIHKAGGNALQEVIDYGETPSRKGLVFMDTPGQDVESMTAMAAGGAQVILFSTGLGSPVGFPLVPVIKITGNPRTYDRMPADIDVNAGAVMTQGKSITDLGEETLVFLNAVCSGELTKSEIQDYSEVSIYKEGITL